VRGFAVVLPIPPSSNTIYRRRGHNPGMYLSQEAKKYKVECSKILISEHLTEIQDLDGDRVYRLELVFYLKAVLNAGWPQKARSRYKRIDLSNRIKLLEDVIKDATSVDDCQHFELLVSKRQADPPEDERVEVRLEPLKEGSWLK
jgi:Holliday junction resolvase RusA-like endonuclease